jgi:hypothetical protein
MTESDIPKSFLIKVLAKCWDEYKAVPCMHCETIVRESAEYQRDMFLCELTHEFGDWADCELCDQSERALAKHREKFVTIASPECVRLADSPIMVTNGGPIVRMSEQNVYGGAGWYVEMVYTVGLHCQHCNGRMPGWGAGYFISEDGSHISCWNS